MHSFCSFFVAVIIASIAIAKPRLFGSLSKTRITSDKLASLVAKAWQVSLSPLNIMTEFKKTGIYSLNPSEVTDRQLALSKLFQKLSTESSQDGSASDNSTN